VEELHGCVWCLRKQKQELSFWLADDYATAVFNKTVVA
jgi:hypothetical protein